MSGDWFKAWLKRHKEINPHKEWRVFESAGFELIYSGWIKAFDDEAIDYPSACAASERMQRDEEKLYPEHHLPRILKFAHQAVAKERAAQAETQRQSELAKEARRREKDERIRLAWSQQPEATQEKHREFIRANYPEMGRFRGFVEIMARGRWAELAKNRKKTQTSS